MQNFLTIPVTEELVAGWVGPGEVLCHAVFPGQPSPQWMPCAFIDGHPVDIAGLVRGGPRRRLHLGRKEVCYRVADCLEAGRKCARCGGEGSIEGGEPDTEGHLSQFSCPDCAGEGMLRRAIDASWVTDLYTIRGAAVIGLLLACMWTRRESGLSVPYTLLDEDDFKDEDDMAASLRGDGGTRPFMVQHPDGTISLPWVDRVVRVTLDGLEMT